MEANGNQSPEMKREERSRSRSPINSSPQERNHSSSRDSSSTRDRDRSQRNRRNVGGDGRGDDRRRSRAPSNRRVYVANIPYDCKWTELKDIFRDKVGDVSYVELFEDHDGKFRGCGIVEFKDNSSVQKAIDVLHRFEIKGRHLVVKEDFDVERDKTGRPVTRSGLNIGRGQDFNANIPPVGENMNIGGLDGGLMNSQFNTYGLSPHFLESLGVTGPLTNRVFVANLDYKVTDKKLQDIFKMAGKVLSIELKTDKEGKSKGHGIVEFDHPVEAVQAISMFNGQKLFTRNMSVRMDKYKEESDGIPSKLPAGLQGIGKGLGSGGQPINIARAAAGAGLGVMGIGGNAPLNAMQGALGNMGMNMGMGAGAGMGAGNLGMGMGTGMGMGAGMGMGNMAGMSGGGGGMGMGMGTGMTGDRSLMGGNMGGGGMGAGMGMTSGVGGLGIGNRNAAGMMPTMGGGGNNALGAGLGSGGGGGMGGNMNVGMGTGLGTGMGMGNNMGMGGGAGGGGSNLDGFGELDRGTDNYRSPRSSDTVIVRNLPTSYNWQTLRDRFRDIGDVRYTEVKGRGTAIVRFSTERDAQRAVDLMHGIRIDGRPIEVQLY